MHCTGWITSHRKSHRDRSSCLILFIMLSLLPLSQNSSHLTEMTSPSSANFDLSLATDALIVFDTKLFLPALMVESIFYGIYFVTFGACLRRIFRTEDRNWKRLRDINLTMTLVALLMFIFLTSHLFLLLVHNMRNVAHSEGPFIIVMTWSNLLRATLPFFQALLVNSVLIYRCWLIWSKRLGIISIPLVGWIGSLVSGSYTLYSRYTLSYLQSNVQIHEQDNFIATTFFWACAILINIYCAGMILNKICSAQRAWSPPTSLCSIQDLPQVCRLRFAKRVIIESGLIYTTMTLILFINHVCQSEGMIIVVAAEIQVTGIAFNLLLSRAADSGRQPGGILPTYEGNNVVSSGPEQMRSKGSAAVMAAGFEEGKL